MAPYQLFAGAPPMDDYTAIANVMCNVLELKENNDKM